MATCSGRALSTPSSSSKPTRDAAPNQPGVQASIPPDQIWRHVLRMEYSIRPSVLSPLHPVYKQQQVVSRRQAFLAASFAAQERLAEQLDAPSEAAAGAEIASRRAKVERLSHAFDALLGRGELARCPPDPAQAQGYYKLLELQAQEGDAEFSDVQRVLAGDADVWEYWFRSFAPEYAGTPQMDPLVAIYQRPAPAQEEQRLRRQADRAVRAARAAPHTPQRDALGRAHATGRRKTSRACVILWPGGEGRVMVNRRPLDAALPDLATRTALLRPLLATGAVGTFNVLVQVSGGGPSGQAQAAAHGIAKALAAYDPDRFRKRLGALRLLRRDPRVVERKKPGKAKARRSFAWVKR